MSSAVEPPPKKRKLVDGHAPSPSSTPAPAAAPPPSPAPPPPAAPPETLAAAAPSSSAPPPETTSLSAEEALQKRRNQEELCRLYECHRRIRNYLASKDPALLPQLEQDYLLLISASRGSASAQRFLSLLIPRFSSYCPTALEAAAKVSINMYKSSIDIVTKGEVGNGFACQTARACIVGLTDICSAASSEAPKSPVLTGICSAVYMTVLAFFVSTFDRKDIYHIGSRNLSVLQDPVKLLETLKELKDTNLPELDYLFELRALCLLCTFLLFPENVLEANFALLASRDTDDVKGGLYFLNQLTSCLNVDVANDALGVKTDGQCSGVDINMSDAGNIVDPQPSSDDNVILRSSMVESNECYMTMAMSRHPSLRRWIFLRYKKICDSGEPALVSELSACLKVLGSLSELAEDTSHMDTEPSVLEKHDKNIRENVRSDEVISSSEQELLSKNDSIDTNVEKSSLVKNVDMDCTDDKISQKLTDAKIDSSEGASVVSVAAHKGMKQDFLTPKSTYDSAGGSTTLTSPGQHSGKAKHLHSEPFDIYGASVSRDVISVSKELWVGSLGNRAAEALVRSKFEEFGPLGNLLFYPSKDFALIEYRNIIHAVRACGNMQGSSIWGGFLQIRYLDRLIGCQGFISGVAIGESRHIYVANVKNQKNKDQVFDQLKAAGLKRPCGITDISNENALLLEFETAVDAATAKVYIRGQTHADVCSKDNSPGHQLLVQNIDSSVPDMEYINAFTRYGEVIRWQFNKPNGNCLIIYRSHDAAAYAKSQLHGARFGMKSITIESRTGTAGSFHDKTVSSVAPMLGQGVPDNSIHHDIRHPIVSGYHSGFAVPGDRPVYGPSPPNTKQVWHHKEMESNRAPQVPPCPPVSTHRGSVMPPPPIQTSFVRPVYPGPGSPWENTTPNPPFSHVSPRMMPGSNFRVNPSGPLPFRPSPAPLVQVPVSAAQHPETMPPLPPLTNSARSPFTPLDRPPPPPPLPISQPPSVPPPPSYPPPLQSTTDSSDPKKSRSHPRWEGSLSKSGLHYCRIYASKVELDACKYENAVSEPAEWPSKLDVTKRTDFQHVKTNFSNSPPSKREVCRLLPCSNGDQKGLRDFISYLKQRECAGVIKIPPVKPMWSRLLFILPPTAEACGMLDLPPHSADCLIALIVPKETTAEAT